MQLAVHPCLRVKHSLFQEVHFPAVKSLLSSLQADHPQVHITAQPLPTFAEFNERVKENKRVSVKDVWGLMLCQVPGELLGSSLPALASLPVSGRSCYHCAEKTPYGYT